MAGTTGTLTAAVVSMLSSTTTGVNARVATINQADPSLNAAAIGSIVALNASVEISEKTGHAHYPALLVYCDKFSNSLREKFRQVSGKAHVVVEVRHSQDRLEALETNTQAYVDAVCSMLDDSRGDWGSGAFYTGGYDVSYEPIARGGKNFLQRAKVGFDVEVSK
jgi:cell division protein ZapA (FtsZ GTPase activity inhibitor)